MSPTRSWSEIAVNTGMLWATTAIAALALWPIYESPAVVVVVIVGLVVGTLVAVAGALWRWPAWLVMVVTTFGFLVVGVPTAVPSQTQLVVLPTVEGLITLVSGVALGWKQLVTITLPVGDYEALLVPALVLILVTVTVGLSVALRARYGELAVLAPIVLYIVAILFGPDEPVRAVITPLVLLVAVLLWLVWFRWRRRRAAIRLLAGPVGSVERVDAGAAGLRTLVGAVLILAISSAAAVAAAATLPPVEQRTVIRTAVEQPFDPRDYVSPLSGFRSYWQDSTVDSVLFTATGVSDGQLVRLATLDTYDGVVFSVGSADVSSLSGAFTRVASTVDQSAAPGDPVSVGIGIQDYSGVWVPTVGKLESITFAGRTATDRRNAFFYNDVTGTAAVLGGITQGDSYTITAVSPAPIARSDLASLDPGSAVVPETIDLPEDIATTLDRYTDSVEGAGARLVAMLEGLATDGYISHGVAEDEPPSRSGHAIDRITELFTAPRMVGDAEQYAVAAALMARELGFPTRVVMGFVPDGGQVHGSDVVAWIEVNTAQRGWVMVDPTPPFREIPDELPEDNALISRPPTIVPPPVVESENFDRQTVPDSERELPPDLNPVLQVILAIVRVLGWVLLVTALVMSPFLVVIVAKLRRRGLRRRAPTSIERIRGGWQEFEDAVVDHGLSPSASATRSEVAGIVGGVQAQVLAAVTDRAVFSPDEPAPSDADSVWRAVDELRTALDAGRTRWERIKATVSVRSLGGYSVRKLFTR
jgi:hypothetical protein